MDVEWEKSKMKGKLERDEAVVRKMSANRMGGISEMSKMSGTNGITGRAVEKKDGGLKAHKLDENFVEFERSGRTCEMLGRQEGRWGS